MELKYKIGDEVIFIHNGTTLKYEVGTNHIFHKNGCNSNIFAQLGISDKIAFCTEAYSYNALDGGFPTCETGDLKALNAVIRALKAKCIPLISKETTRESIYVLLEEKLAALVAQGAVHPFDYVSTSGTRTSSVRKPRIVAAASLKNSYIDCGAGFLWEISGGKELCATILPKTEELETKKPEIVEPTDDAFLEKLKEKYPIGCTVEWLDTVGEKTGIVTSHKFKFNNFLDTVRVDYLESDGYLYIDGKFANIIPEPTFIDRLQKEMIESYPGTPKECFTNGVSSEILTTVKKKLAKQNKVESLPLFKIKQF